MGVTWTVTTGFTAGAENLIKQEDTFTDGGPYTRLVTRQQAQ